MESSDLDCEGCKQLLTKYKDLDVDYLAALPRHAHVPPSSIYLLPREPVRIPIDKIPVKVIK